MSPTACAVPLVCLIRFPDQRSTGSRRQAVADVLKRGVSEFFFCARVLFLKVRQHQPLKRRRKIARGVNSWTARPKKRTAKRWQSFHRRWSFPLTTIDDLASFRGSVQATRNLAATADELASSRRALEVQCLVVPAL